MRGGQAQNVHPPLTPPSPLWQICDIHIVGAQEQQEKVAKETRHVSRGDERALGMLREKKQASFR